MWASLSSSEMIPFILCSTFGIASQLQSVVIFLMCNQFFELILCSFKVEGKTNKQKVERKRNIFETSCYFFHLFSIWIYSMVSSHPEHPISAFQITLFWSEHRT